MPESEAFSGLSCPTASLCVTADRYSENAWNWNPSLTGYPTSLVASDSQSEVGPVYCASADLCFIGDGGARLHTSADSAGDGSAWGVANFDPATSPSAFACPSASQCVAVDYAGNVLAGVPGGTPTPVDDAPPTIAGTAVQGQTLTESNGTWVNAPTFYAYQWEDCDARGATCCAGSNASG
jgi:hypothetical protein